MWNETETDSTAARDPSHAEPAAAPSASMPALAGIEMAPHMLLRYATQPANRMEAMRLRQTESHLDQHREARRRMDALGAAVSDDLFALVPRLAEDESRLRRAVLQLRRDAHQRQATSVKLADRAEVLARLVATDDDGAARLAAWIAAQQLLVDSLAAARASFDAEMQTVLRPALRAPLLDASFRRALEMASPGLAAQARRERKLPHKPEPDNYERSLMGYVMRATAKTSPLSSFMATSSLSWSAERGVGLPRLRQERLHGRTRLNRGANARLERALQQRLARSGAVPLVLNPSFKALPDGRYRALCCRDLVLLKRPWREQRRAQFQLHDSVGRVLVRAIGQPAKGWTDWAAQFEAEGVAADQVPPLLDKLLRRDLLQVPTLSDGFTDSPRFAWPAGTDTARWAPAREAFEALQATAVAAAGADDQRIQALADIGEREAAALQALGEDDAEPLQNLVIEDCWATLGGEVGGLPRVGPAAPEWAGLSDLRDFLATQVEISPQYVRLRAHFIERFGADGVCEDVVDFLTEVSDKLVEVNEYGNALKEGAPAPAHAGAMMGVTAQVQLVPAAQPGQPGRLVVNKVFDRPAWLAARFAFGDSAQHELLRAELAEWLQTLSGDAEPVDVMVNGHCNELQAHPRLTARVLAWPGEPLCVPREQQLPASTLVLSHDGESGLLRLVERHSGRRINLLYLGSTFPTANWGVPFALSILTQPYRLQRPAAAPPSATDDADASAQAAPAADFVAEPRLERGNMVLRRASWWVRARHLNAAWFGAKGVDRLLAVADDCRRNGLPPRFFVQGSVAARHDMEVSADVLDGYRKPLWVDVRNPFCLSLLERMAERFDWLTVTEALPDPDSSWLVMDEQPHVSELQLEMMVTAA
jgi:hypothetical protein